MPKGIPKNGINKGQFKKKQIPWNYGKKTERICKYCGKVFYRESGGKFCSRHCSGKATGFKKGVSSWNQGMSCSWIKKPRSIKVRKKIAEALSGRTRPEISGENHYKWSGGHSRSIQKAEWRNSIYKRDNYECQMCGKHGYLEAHHIKPWKEYPDLRFDLDNGITLCLSCHYKVHNKKMRKAA